MSISANCKIFEEMQNSKKRAKSLIDKDLALVFWCPRRDSNPHILRHMDLNHARLPIPPRGQRRRDYMRNYLNIQLKIQLHI